MNVLALVLPVALALPASLQAPAQESGSTQIGSSETASRAPFAIRALQDIRTTCGSPQKDFILEVNGGGLALEDFDADGDLDLVVVDGSTLERVAAGLPGLPPRYLANDGAGTFRAPERDSESETSWELSAARWGMGAAVGDVNGDGFPDLLVTEWGPDQLFVNQAGAGFKSSESSGLTGKRWGTSAAFFDADLDGDLDLAIVNYLAFSTERIKSRATGACRWKGHSVMCGPEGLTPVHDQLYLNSGTGQYEDVSSTRGFRPREAGFGLGIVTLDADVDGDTDLYVTNDSTPNHLWQNDGAGSFREIGFMRGVGLDPDGKEQAGMGVWANDVNLDGVPDLAITNFSGEPNALYLSRGKRWGDRSAQMGIGGASQTTLGWGTALEDFDGDGLVDLVVLNGHVYPQANAPGTDTGYAQPDLFHRGRAAGRMTTERLFLGEPFVARAATAGDIDGDGDLDVVALAIEGPVRVLTNLGTTGNYLRVRLRGKTGNTAALGARVRVVIDAEDAADGVAYERWREIGASAGFQAARPAVAHFGLGANERVSLVEVTWPGGAVSRVEDVAAGSIEIEEPQAEGKNR